MSSGIGGGTENMQSSGKIVPDLMCCVDYGSVGELEASMLSGDGRQSDKRMKSEIGGGFMNLSSSIKIELNHEDRFKNRIES